MVGRYDALDALFNFQRALEARLESDWLRGGTTGTGAFPSINVSSGTQHGPPISVQK
jgi:hypothetical protein